MCCCASISAAFWLCSRKSCGSERSRGAEVMASEAVVVCRGAADEEDGEGQ
jgi:hypothetical protein